MRSIRRLWWTPFSLALCAAIFLMWIHSYRKCDLLIDQRGPQDRLEVVSEFGLLVMELENPQSGQIAAGWSYFPKSLPRRWHHGRGLLGFAAYESASRHYLRLPPTTLRGVVVPWWFIFALSSTPAALWLRSRRRARRIIARAARSRCIHCGYDIRFSPARCPECGEAVSHSSTLLAHLSF